MITNVVVPLDGSPLAATAIEPARALAEATGATLRLLAAEPLTRWREQIHEANDYLEQQAASTGLPAVETLVVGDKAARQAILMQSQAPGAVVCMATHGRSGMGHAALGSVAEAILHDSDRPLVLVGPSMTPAPLQLRHGNLLIAVDGSPASDAIIPIASDWAQMLELRPWVVEVVTTPTSTVGDAPERTSESATVRHIAQGLHDGGMLAQWEVLHDPDTADALLDYANQLPAALIAMATHGRTGLARVALGSVAMQVVHRGPCPVLVARSPNLVE
jgi:nucleotide-binding universal stress UspA family protein